MEAEKAFSFGTILVALSDLAIGMVGSIAFFVLFFVNGVQLPVFRGEFTPVTGNEKLRFFDDPLQLQYGWLGTMSFVGFMLIFGILLLWGVYKKNKLLLKIWNVFNVLGCAIFFGFFMYIATTEYSILSIVGVFQLGFRFFQIWIVQSYIETIEQDQALQMRQGRKMV